MDTPEGAVARVYCAGVVVITIDWSLYKLSGLAVARMRVAFVVQVELSEVVLRCVDAPANRIAGIDRAWVAVGTADGGIDALTGGDIAKVPRTGVVVVAVLCAVHAFAGLGITGVGCAEVTIVAVLRRPGADPLVRAGGASDALVAGIARLSDVRWRYTANTRETGRGGAFGRLWLWTFGGSRA